MHHSYYILEKNIKKVYQYDLNKNFVSEYKSLSEAARINDINVSGICQACKNKLKTYKNYYWSYEKM